jgi:NitT/TauT family transport system ATP-binding protein
MADKVIVLSHRPAIIKSIIDINLTNKSTPIENRKCPEFTKFYEQIWKEIDYHV